MFIGELFYDPDHQYLSFEEAQLYCRAAGAQLATTAQLHFASSKGLDNDSPGWLADGSVRSSVGGREEGVITSYRFDNQTGFPDPSSLHDVYCFKGLCFIPHDISVME